MCLAKAYIGFKGKNELLMEEIASVKVADDKLLLATLFGETKEIAGRIKEIDFKSSNILLENIKS